MKPSEDTTTLPGGAAYEPGASKYLLTLRYNPLLPATLPVITAREMGTMKPAPQSTDAIESMVSAHLKAGLQDVSDDPYIAVALSGGIDSTLVLGMLRKYFPSSRVIALSVRFEDSYDETDQAARTSKAMDVEHVIVDVDNYMEEIPAAIHATSLPMWDLHWYHIAKHASINKADVIISGDGGDELFGGYTFRYKGFLAECEENEKRHTDSPETRARAYLNNHSRDHVPDQEEIFGPRMKFRWGDIMGVLLPHFDNGLRPLEQVFLADYNGKLLYNFAHVNGAMSRHFGIKSVSPLLSEDVIRYAMGMPAEEKYDAATNAGKLPLRSLLRSMKIGHLALDSKVGFSPNTLSYWKSHGYDMCSKYLATDDARTIADGWICKEWVRGNLACDIKDVRYVNKFLGLLAFEVWYRIFITHDLDPGTRLR